MSRAIRVLIIEDSPADATLIEWELTHAGYDPVTRRIERAPELVAALADATWDLIICDYRLPQFSAQAALALLKAHGSDVPFIIISGAIGEEECRIGAGEGPADCLLWGDSHAAAAIPAVVRAARIAGRDGYAYAAPACAPLIDTRRLDQSGRR